MERSSWEGLVEYAEGRGIFDKGIIVIAGTKNIQGTIEGVCYIQGEGNLGIDVGRLCKFGTRKLMSAIL